MNGRGNFGVMRPTDNPYASMGQWSRADALDLSKYFQGGQPQENSNGQVAGSAVSGIAGNVFNALMKKRKLGDIARSGTPTAHMPGTDDTGITNKASLEHGLPMFARGGKLKKGINIVGENGPEIAIQGDDGTAIVPLTTDASVSSNVTNRPMQPVPTQNPFKGDISSIVQDAPQPQGGQDTWNDQPDLGNGLPNWLNRADITPPNADPYNPAGRMPNQQPQNPADATWSEIQRREGKQFDATPVLDAQGEPVIGPDGKPMMRPGKDNAKTHNWKDVLKSIGLGVLNGADKIGPNDNIGSTLGKLVGGAGFGAGYTALDRNADEKMGNDRALQKLYGDYQRQYGTQQQRQADAQKQRMGEANIAIAEGKPELAKAEQDRKARAQDLAEVKAAIDAQYKDNVIKLGASKADEIRRNNEKLYELKSRGLDQNDVRIKILEDRNAEIARHNQAVEKLGGDRQASIDSRQKSREAFQMQMQKDRQQYGAEGAVARAKQGIAQSYAKQNGVWPTKEEIDAMYNQLLAPMQNPYELDTNDFTIK